MNFKWPDKKGEVFRVSTLWEEEKKIWPSHIAWWKSGGRISNILSFLGGRLFREDTGRVHAWVGQPVWVRDSCWKSVVMTFPSLTITVVGHERNKNKCENDGLSAFPDLRHTPSAVSTWLTLADDDHNYCWNPVLVWIIYKYIIFLIIMMMIIIMIVIIAIIINTTNINNNNKKIYILTTA